MSKFPPSKKPINPVVKVAPKLVWSEYQKAIFKDIAKGEGHTIINAYAGSSKTTSLVESFKYVPRGKKILALAFNKKNQEDLREKSPSYVDCLTFHSLGLRAIKKRFINVQIDEYKMMNIFKEILGDDELYDVLQVYCDVVAYCKYSLTDTPTAIGNMIDDLQVDTFDIPRKEFLENVIKALSMCKKQTNIIDFNDMCYFPYIFNLPLDTYDYVYLDEFQDVNKSQIFMAKKSLKPKIGRMIATGDEYQAIYGFRLADHSTVLNLLNEPKAKKLKLPISYRCPKKVINLAKKYIPDIECPESAIEGEVNEINYAEMYKSVQAKDFIISRTNAPLIKICMQLIKNGKKANIQGRDVGKNLQSLVKKSQKKKVKEFLPWLDEWLKEQVEIFATKNIPTDNLYDKRECLVNLCEDCVEMDEVSSNIKNLFSDESDSKGLIILSSCHKIKGRETDNVYVLRKTFRSFWDEHETEHLDECEESNIFYVAITRSKSKLNIVK